MKTSLSGDGTTKICTKCGRRLPLVAYRKYSGRGRLGLRPLCKECQRSYEAGWRSKTKEYRRLARLRRVEKTRTYSARYNKEHRGELLAKEATRRARHRGLPCDLPQHYHEIEERVQKARCELTGIPLILGNTRPVRWDSPSLDRINPSKGYLYSNIRVVCFAINAAMGNWGEERLRLIINAWLAKK